MYDIYVYIKFIYTHNSMTTTATKVKNNLGMLELEIPSKLLV